MKKWLLTLLTLVMGVFIMNSPAKAFDVNDIAVIVNESLMYRDADGTEHSKLVKLKVKYYKLGAAFPVPEVNGYQPDMTGVPKVVTKESYGINIITYHALPATVTVNYVDQQTQQKVAESTTLSGGTIDGEYHFTAPEVAGYHLIDSNQLTGQITNTNQVVTVALKKDAATEPPVEPEKPTEPEKPNPDDKPQPGNDQGGGQKNHDDQTDQPEENKPVVEWPITVMQMTNSGRILQRDSQMVSSGKLAKLMSTTWQFTGYQFDSCQYDELTKTLKVIYQPKKVTIQVVATSPTGEELLRKQVVADYGSEVDLLAPVISGYQTNQPSRKFLANTETPAEQVFIYHPQLTSTETPKEAEKPKKSDETVGEAENHRAPSKKDQQSDEQVKSNQQTGKPETKQIKPTTAAVKFTGKNPKTKTVNAKTHANHSRKLPQTNEVVSNWPVLCGLGFLGTVGWLRFKLW